MSQVTSHSPLSVRRLGLAVGLLTAVLLVCFPLFGWFAYQRSGSDGLVASGVAFLVCWLGCSGALLVTALFQGPAALQGLLLGMILRMGLPLGAGVVLTQVGGRLAEAGVFGIIVVYYLIALLTETLLSVWLVGSPRDPKASQVRDA